MTFAIVCRGEGLRAAVCGKPDGNADAGPKGCNQSGTLDRIMQIRASGHAGDVTVNWGDVPWIRK